MLPVTVFGILFFTFCLFFKPSSGACYSPESCLKHELFLNYDPAVRPAFLPNDVVTLNLTLHIRSLSAIDEKKETMTIVGSLEIQWIDQFLQWDPSDFNHTRRMVLFPRDVWLPDTAVVNSAESVYKTTYREDFRILLLSSGHIRWAFGGHIHTSCPLDITYYPFDEQKCGIRLENWQYPLSMVDLQFSTERGDAIFTEAYQENSLWILQKTDTVRDTYGSERISYPALNFKFYWKRKPLYYIYNIIIPTVFIVGITLGLFWLPPGCGEKVSLGITVLLAFSVFQIIIADSTPVNSDTSPIISQMVMFVMCMATVSLLISMISVYLDSSSDTNRVPGIIRLIAFKYMARIFCLMKEVPEINEKEFSHKIKPTTDVLLADKNEAKKIDNNNELMEILKEMREITSHIRDTQRKDQLLNEWKLLSKLIDRLLFWLCFIIITIYAIVVITKISSA